MVRKGYPTVHHEAAEDLLSRIAAVTRDLNHINDEIAAKMQMIKDAYRLRLEGLRADFEVLEKQLMTLARKRKAELYGREDLVRLRSGLLKYQLEWPVLKARKVLENLEMLGRLDVVKVAKSVDWDALEKWGDEDLAAVGTKRQKKEQYSYELSGL